MGVQASGYTKVKAELESMKLTLSLMLINLNFAERVGRRRL
jgi:hypothetical protein